MDSSIASLCRNRGSASHRSLRPCNQHLLVNFQKHHDIVQTTRSQYYAVRLAKSLNWPLSLLKDKKMSKNRVNLEHDYLIIKDRITDIKPKQEKRFNHGLWQEEVT